ncbi:MAG: RNA ligase [Synergistaceae bacterium]
MTMHVQKYLREKGLKSLIDEFHIDVREYDDRIVLNYDQIESPRFHPICDECRALILRKSDWSVMARSFDRFYNWGEGVEDRVLKENPLMQRITIDPFSSTIYDGNNKFMPFPLQNSLVQEKLDGSLISVYWDGEDWCASTRKMAHAEGQTNFGTTFSEIFWGVDKDLKEKLSKSNCHQQTIVFELTGPANRIVTAYPNTGITLIGGRWNLESLDYKELTAKELDDLEKSWGITRPKNYEVDDATNLISLVHGFPAMDEGVVLVYENTNGSHFRVKVKNPRYVAIANMRANGGISPKRILFLIMENEHHEYLKYFEEDLKYFKFVEEEYLEAINRITNTWNKVKDIKDQKEFALTMMPLTEYSFEKGLLFSVRKNGTTVEQELKKIEPKKIALSMNLKGKFAKEFGVQTEEEDE